VREAIQEMGDTFSDILIDFKNDWQNGGYDRSEYYIDKHVQNIIAEITSAIDRLEEGK
jgi:hypothetical protein